MAVTQHEARVFGRYLVGREPPQEFVDRYQAANRMLIREPASPEDAAAVEYACRHPWSVPFLDAACGLRRRNGLLRTKIFIMAAVLEASSEFADEFLPRSTHRARLVLQLAGLGALGLVRAVLGSLLYLFVSRSRR